MPDLRECPVCKTAPIAAENRGDRVNIKCARCGNFGVSGTAAVVLPGLIDRDKRKAALIAHMLSRMQASDKCPLLSSDVAEKILRTESLPTPEVQADNLVRWLGDNSPEPGEPIELDPVRLSATIGVITKTGFDFIVSGLQDAQLIEVAETMFSLAHAFLTFRGWQRYEALRLGAPSGRVAFMAMKFGEPASDEFLDDHLRPAVKSTGFELRRLDDNPKAGLIDDRLRVEIRASRFLIADLTHANNGAYWEAGYAEGLGKPVIYTCKKSEFAKASHFDTNHHLTVLWETDQLPQAARNLANTIRATIPEASRG
jgi:hypothetical protein